MLKLVSLCIGLIDTTVYQIHGVRARSAFGSSLTFSLKLGSDSYFVEASIKATEQDNGYLLAPRIEDLVIKARGVIRFEFRADRGVLKNDVSEEALDLIAKAFRHECDTVLSYLPKER